MIFSKEYLDDVKCYTSKSYFSEWALEYRTVFVLHYKCWWKPRKKLTFAWNWRSETNKYHESAEAVQLRQCLFNYFGSK
jgi:hypothetical protein